MRKGLLLATFLLGICSCPLTNAMTKKEFLKFWARSNLTKEEIAMIHYDINPEFAETLRLLVRMDRQALKTILENQAALFENLLVSMIFEAYNASTQAAHCATQTQRAHHKNLIERKTQIESIIDQSLDTMYRKWGELETQDDLEAYFTKYWDDRNALYNYVSQRNSREVCNGSGVVDQTCTAVESLQACFSKASAAMGQCKSTVVIK